MDVIEFERVVVARREAGKLLIALFDGAKKKGTPNKCVVLLTCDDDGARVLVRTVENALNSTQM